MVQARQETRWRERLNSPNSNKQKAERAYALAYEYEQKHGNCPQCVLAAVQEAVGEIDDEVFKASHALAGGGALCGAGTCGALVGGMLAISAKHGRDRENFGKGRYLHNYMLGKKLFDRFVAEFGDPTCGAVQTKVIGRSFNLWDKNDYKAFEDAGGHRDKCTDVAGKAAMWTAEILLEGEVR
jgi:C_GCAxxG_C_C family probable redox protein